MNTIFQAIRIIAYYTSTNAKRHVRTRDIRPNNPDAQVEEGRKRALELDRLRKLNYRLYDRYYRRR